MKLMEETNLHGHSAVATSKLPWVASEYIVGQMGGSAGNGRKDNFGYTQNGKPINRLLGNGFIISISVNDYINLRNSNYLIDVNVDMDRGVAPNRAIEEVTFVSKIESKYVKGSLPMILPRLDRDWIKMSDKKKSQYSRVFGLNEKIYNEFKKYLSNQKYPLGKLTEHLIQHHGNLMKKIAIKNDRQEGYTSKFVVPKNPYYYGLLGDIDKNGQALASRTARTESAKKVLDYFPEEEQKYLIESQKSNSDNESNLTETKEEELCQNISSLKISLKI